MIGGFVNSFNFINKTAITKNRVLKKISSSRHTVEQRAGAVRYVANSCFICCRSLVLCCCGQLLPRISDSTQCWNGCDTLMFQQISWRDNFVWRPNGWEDQGIWFSLFNFPSQKCQRNSPTGNTYFVWLLLLEVCGLFWLSLLIFRDISSPNFTPGKKQLSLPSLRRFHSRNFRTALSVQFCLKFNFKRLYITHWAEATCRRPLEWDANRTQNNLCSQRNLLWFNTFSLIKSA